MKDGTLYERFFVTATYTVAGTGQSGRIEFVGRKPVADKAYNGVTKAQRAVARRLRVKPSSVNITGIMCG